MIRQLAPAPRPHLTPVKLADARRFVGLHHSHNLPPRGWLFGVGVTLGDQLAAVGIAGRPSARKLDDGSTIEITRVCSDGGCPNACSMIYGALWRAATALGYRRAFTYTLADEHAAALKATGWLIDAELPARGGWDNGRHRVETDLFGNGRTPTGPKVRWLKEAA